MSGVLARFGDVTVRDGDKIALKADNGKDLSRINRGDTNPIEAAKPSIDEFCTFTLIPANGPIAIAGLSIAIQ